MNILKNNHLYRKVISLTTIVTLMASSFIFVGSKPTYAEEATSKLIISEVSDTKNDYTTNRYVEIYNTDEKPVSLDGYVLNVKMNTAKTATVISANLTGVIGAGEAKVIAPAEFPSAYSGIALGQGSAWAAFNGGADDVVSLEYNGAVVDFFGGVSFVDQNAVRLNTVNAPKSTFDASEWKLSSCLTVGIAPSTPNVHTCDFPANQLPAIERVMPTIQEGAVFGGTEVGFTVATEGAIIFASKNGGSSEVFTNSFTITDPKTVFNVKATKSGAKDSVESTYTYYVPDTIEIDKIAGLANQTPVLIEGVVTGLNGSDIYLKGSQGSVAVSKSKWLPTDSASYSIGAKIKVAGIKDLNPTFPTVYTSGVHAIQELGTDVVNARVVKLSELGAANHSELVTVKNVTIGPKTGTVYELSDDSGKFFIYLDRVNGFTPVVGMKIESITANVADYKGNLQLVPRNATDIIEDSNKLAPPTAERTAGASAEEGKVELKHSETGVSIYYEIGKDLESTKEPTNASKKYDGFITITPEEKVIKAMACKEGMKDSSVAVFEYLFGNVKVSDIQGKSHTSPFLNKSVSNVAGYVTAKDAKGFYLQATGKDADSDDETSDAIYVFTKSSDVSVGDYVKVSGKVAEYAASSPAKSLSTTQIVLSGIEKLASTEPKPAPIIIGLNGRKVPTQVIDNDQFTVYDPNEDAIDFFESVEGMLVKVEKPIVGASYVSKSGSNVTISVASDAGKISPEKITKYNGFKLIEGSQNPELIQIGDLITSNIKSVYGIPMTGDQYKDDIVGVMAYDYGAYKLQNTAELPEFVKNPLRVRETTTIAPSDDKLTIASYNIENFNSKTEEARRNGIAKSIVENLKAPDIIGLVEMQDNDGEDKTDNPDASQTFKVLIDEILKVSNGKEVYEYVQINPEYNKDGGAPGANIRVGFLYKPQRVELAKAPQGTAIQGVKYENGHLSLNPGRILTDNEAIFEATRKSLAAEFIFKGQSYFVIANHFSSKSGSTPVFGSEQPFIDPPLENRIKQAQVVNDFIKGILAENSKANVVALGDFNDFEFAKATRALAGNEMTNLHDTLPVSERVTYIYNGSSQVLDHILVAKGMVEKCSFDPVNINAMFTANEGRVSDHDPVLVQIEPNANGVLNLNYVVSNFNQFVGKTISVEGVISSKVRVGKGNKNGNFYIQDNMGGMPIYLLGLVGDIKEGDHVKLEGVCSLYSESFMQLKVSSADKIIKLSSENVVTPQTTTLDQLSIDKNSQLVELKKVTLVKKEADSYKNGLFTFKENDKEFAVKLDSRFGEAFDSYQDDLKIGSVYSVKGYVEYDINKNTLTIQLDDSKDITLYGKVEEELPLTVSTSAMNYQGTVKNEFGKNEMIYIQVDVKKKKDSAGKAVVLYKMTKDNTMQRFGMLESELIRVNDNSVRYGFDTTGLAEGTYNVTVYVWDGMDTMCPIADESQIQITIK